MNNFLGVKMMVFPYVALAGQLAPDVSGHPEIDPDRHLNTFKQILIHKVS